MSSAHDDTMSPKTEDVIVGPVGHGDAVPRSTTPEVSPALSYVTAVEHAEEMAAVPNLEAVSALLGNVHVEDHPAGAVVDDDMPEKDSDAQSDVDSDNDSVPDGMVIVFDDSDIEPEVHEPEHPAPPAYVEHDNVPAYNAPRQAHGLPQIYTINGFLADLDTPVDDFVSWIDYKLICLSGPKITLILEESGGVLELPCSRKLLKDSSDTFRLMNLMFLHHDRLNITGLFADLPVGSATATFVHLYELTSAGALPLPVSGDIPFMTLMDLYVMADFLGMPWARSWLSTYVKAKMAELSANWTRDYDTALILETVPRANREAGRARAIPIPHRLSPVQMQAARLRDVQDAYMHARFNPGAKVVLPSQLAQLVSDACPAELRFRLQASGQLCDGFLRALSIFDLKRRVEARHRADADRAMHE